MKVAVVRVTVNGQPRDLPRGSTVADVVADMCAAAAGVAVAVDREVVPRSRWAGVALEEGDLVEVVTAVAGG